MIIYYIQRIRDEKIKNIIKESTNKFIDNIITKTRNHNIQNKSNIHKIYEKKWFTNILSGIFGFFIGYTLSLHSYKKIK